MGQINPGGPTIPGSFRDAHFDSEASREVYFKKGLDKIKQIQNIGSIAFPFKVACGLAGGNWDHYLPMIEEFAKEIKEQQNAKTYIYKL